MVSRLKIPVHIEAIVSKTCILPFKDVSDHLRAILSEDSTVFTNGPMINPKLSLQGQVHSVSVCDLQPGQQISFWQAELHIHVYKLSHQPSDCDYLEGEEDIAAAEQWELPNAFIHGIWDSIVVDQSIKTNLLNYGCASLLFSESGIDPNIISWNKMLLLYGPPGTGKTSLCKALAQKLFIRNSIKFTSSLLFEINAHSLFSKWFSESAKLVMKLFNHINEIAEDSNCFVVLLIDEVESIASARSSANKSGEPGDAIRVVNSVLTSLDTLRRKPNILILCTSNMLESLDEAFYDRLDLRIFLGNPPSEARYEIIKSVILEMVNKGILVGLEDQLKTLMNHTCDKAVNLEQLTLDTNTQYSMYWPNEPDQANLSQTQYLKGLIALVDASEGMSGRALRKLPLQAFASSNKIGKMEVSEFLEIAKAAIPTARSS